MYRYLRKKRVEETFTAGGKGVLSFSELLFCPGWSEERGDRVKSEGEELCIEHQGRAARYDGVASDVEQL